MIIRLGALLFLISALPVWSLAASSNDAAPESYVGRGAGDATGKSQAADNQDTTADVCDRCEQMAAGGNVYLSSCSNPKCLNRAQQYLPPVGSNTAPDSGKTAK